LDRFICPHKTILASGGYPGRKEIKGHSGTSSEIKEVAYKPSKKNARFGSLGFSRLETPASDAQFVAKQFSFISRIL
jgi:hypothetical protein